MIYCSSTGNLYATVLSDIIDAYTYLTSCISRKVHTYTFLDVPLLAMPRMNKMCVMLGWARLKLGGLTKDSTAEKKSICDIII